MCIFAKFAKVEKTSASPTIQFGYFHFIKKGFGRLLGSVDMINIISFHFVIVAIAVLLLGWYFAENRGLLMVIGDSYSEWLGILVDALLLYFINWAIRREERDKLINQFASESNDFALDATKRLRKKGWLTDGRLSGIDMCNAKLEGANLSKSKLQDIDFSYATLTEAILVEADLSNSNLIFCILVL